MSEAPTVAAAPQRAKKLTIVLDGTMVTIPVEAFGVKRSTSSDDDSERTGSTRLVCPETHPGGAVRVHQKYVCDDDSHGPFSRGEVHSARELPDGKLVKLSAEELEIAKFGEIEKGTMTVKAYPAHQVAATTRPGPKQYRLRAPGKGGAIGDKQYAGLIALVDQPDTVWVGEIRWGASFALYRLELWKGQVCVTELLRPDDLADPDDIDVDVSDKDRAAATAFAAMCSADWNPADWTNDVGRRLDEAAAAKLTTNDDDNELVAPTPIKEAATFDLAALLEATVSAATTTDAASAAA